MAEMQKSKAQNFVEDILERSLEDKEFRASLRCANNPKTEWRAWPTLICRGIQVDSPDKDAYCLVAAAVSYRKSRPDGTLSLGEALRESATKGEKSLTGAEARLRRLFSCDSLREACTVLRPVLGLLQSRLPDQLSLGGLLEDLLSFNSWKRDRVKERWAMDFYRSKSEDAESD